MESREAPVLVASAAMSDIDEVIRARIASRLAEIKPGQQTKIAKATGTTQPTVSLWTSGKIPKQWISFARLCMSQGWSADDVLGLDGRSRPPAQDAQGFLVDGDAVERFLATEPQSEEAVEVFREMIGSITDAIVRVRGTHTLVPEKIGLALYDRVRDHLPEDVRKMYGAIVRRVLGV
jgi:hypothetical protein